MQKYADNNKVVYIKNNKNLGGALARNEGIFNATGDYITFLDDDDIYLPQKIEVQLGYMLKNDWDLSFSDVRIHNNNDILIDYENTSMLRNYLIRTVKAAYNASQLLQQLICLDKQSLILVDSMM